MTMQLYRVDDGDYWSMVMADTAEDAIRVHLRDVSAPEDESDIVTAVVWPPERAQAVIEGMDAAAIAEYLTTDAPDEPWVAFLCGDLC